MISALLQLPYLPYLLGAIAAPFLADGKKRYALLLVPIIAAVFTFRLEPGLASELSLYGISIDLMNIDSLSLFFCWIFHLISFLSLLYGMTTLTKSECAAAQLYTASALGVVLSGDFFSFYVFWELLGVSALLFILERRKYYSLSTALHYMLMHFFGGLCLLFGLLMVAAEGGSYQVSTLQLESVGSILVFVGIGMNAAWPLFHTWLTDAYPRATIGGTVFLSALTTKAAIYALARMFPGTELLVVIGSVMAAFPIFYAVIENDLRKVLAYSLINQVGFMVVGVGVGSSLAVNGALSHAFNDILFKGLLFMSVGAVMYRTGKVKATDLGGLYRCMPFTCLCCIVGAASISAFPLFSGFVSKSMVVTAVAEEHLTAVWLILLFASAGVFHHAGIKIPFFVFFGHDSGLRVKEAPRSMLVAMGITALCCIGIGTFPHQTVYALLPYPNEYEPYTVHHVVSQLQLLFFSALAFVMLLRSGMYPAEICSVNLDADWFSKKIIPIAVRWFVRKANIAFEWTEQMTQQFVRMFLAQVSRLPYLLYSASSQRNGQLAQFARGQLLPLGVTAVFCLFALCILSLWGLFF